MHIVLCKFFNGRVMDMERSTESSAVAQYEQCRDSCAWAVLLNPQGKVVASFGDVTTTMIVEYFKGKP